MVRPKGACPGGTDVTVNEETGACEALWRRGLVGLRRGDRDLHADSMFLAFILLESAPIFRIVLFVFAQLGGQVLASNGEPVDGGALFRTVLVLALLMLGYWSCGRLRRNILPLVLIGLVLVGALVFLPWSLDSVPS